LHWKCNVAASGFVPCRHQSRRRRRNKSPRRGSRKTLRGGRGGRRTAGGVRQCKAGDGEREGRRGQRQIGQFVRRLQGNAVGAIEEYAEFATKGSSPEALKKLYAGQSEFHGGDQDKDSVKYAFGAEFVEVRVNSYTLMTVVKNDG
jgi:xanthine dehydrogenase YagR molybdenum-binding subunit